MKTLCLCILLIIATPLLADDDESDSDFSPWLEELPLGDSPFPQEAGEWQLTFSVEHFEDDDDDESVTDLSLEIEYGITDWLQFGVAVPYRFFDPHTAGEEDASGFGDVQLEVLLRLLEGEFWIVSFGAEVAFDTGDETRELGEGNTVYELAFHAGCQLGPVQIYSSLGAEIERDELLLVYGLTIVGEPMGPVTLLVEWTGEYNESGVHESFIAPGIAVELIDDVELLFAVPVGLTTASEDWGAVLRLAIEF